MTTADATHMRRCCNSCRCVGGHERNGALWQCENCGALMPDNDELIPRSPPSTEQAHRAVLRKPSNGHTPAPMPAVEPAPAAEPLTAAFVANELCRDVPTGAAVDLVERYAAQRAEHWEKAFRSLDANFNTVASDRDQLERDCDGWRQRAEAAERRVAELTRELVDEQRRHFEARSDAEARLYAREAAEREFAEEREEWRESVHRLCGEKEAAERKLAELTRAAREATESDSDPVFYALSRVLDRQARGEAREGGDAVDAAMDAHAAEMKRVELPPRLLHEAPAQPADAERCTCGSGAHPRRCERHPEHFELHCAQLNVEGHLEDGPASGEAMSRLEAATAAALRHERERLQRDLDAARAEVVRLTGKRASERRAKADAVAAARRPKLYREEGRALDARIEQYERDLASGEDQEP